VFTLRQLEVVQMCAQGCTVDEIAAELGIGRRTARAHCDAIRWKLGGIDSKERIAGAYRRLTGNDPFEAGLS
jgi:DNA-binding CsgD family transcriptional regulator